MAATRLTISVYRARASSSFGLATTAGGAACDRAGCGSKRATSSKGAAGDLIVVSFIGGTRERTDTAPERSIRETVAG
jgi:hypothetical protein